MISLTDKIVAISEALDAARLPHAFGGALALAWCTQRARGTIDIDVNVFAPAERTAEVLAALPHDIAHDSDDGQRCLDTGQVRLWWGSTPVDVFLNTTPFHDNVALRATRHDFAGRAVAFLGCTDLAVFKAFFDRTRDWADIEEMIVAGTLDIERVLGVLVSYLGLDDPRVARLHSIAPPP